MSLQLCGAPFSSLRTRPPAKRLPLGRLRWLSAAMIICIFSCLLGSSDGARVTGLSPSNGPSLGGADVLLLGEELGAVDMGPKARVSGTACSRTTWMSESAIMCRMDVLDGGIGINKAVLLTVLQYSGGAPREFKLNVEPFFTFDTLIVSQARPFNGPTTAQAGPIAMIGRGFSPVDYSMSARMGMSACESSQWVSDSAVRCKNSPSVLQYLSLGVTLDRIEISRTQAYSYDRPALSKVGPGNAGAAGGQPLTIFGKGFGALDPTQDARLHMEAGEFTCLRSVLAALGLCLVLDSSATCPCLGPCEYLAALSWRVADDTKSLSGGWQHCVVLRLFRRVRAAGGCGCGGVGGIDDKSQRRYRLGCLFI